MKIVVDSKETAGVIQQLCDIALKVNGIQALQQITQILQSITIEEKKEDTKS
jgi:hypothetical protein